MLRSLYIQLLRLHPAAFRRRYGDEMLSIFDEAGRPAPLLADALLSLTRQWVLREHEPLPEPTPVAGVPSFYCADQSLPPKGALLNGAVVASALFAVVAFALGHGTGPRPWTTQPEEYGRAAGNLGFGVEGGQSTVVFGGSGGSAGARSGHAEPGSDSLWIRIIRLAKRKPAVRLIVTPAIFDTDHDGILSGREIDQAATALARLDFNRDGAVNLGDNIAGTAPLSTRGESTFLPPQRAAAERGVIRLGRSPLGRASIADAANAGDVPVLPGALMRILDLDHDGALSAAERSRAPLVLRSFDRNRDGRVTPDEWPPEDR